jgi:hypothetical protein
MNDTVAEANGLNEPPQTGTNLAGKKKWDKHQRIAMIISSTFVVLIIGFIVISRDDVDDTGAASTIPRAPAEIKKVVPGDELPPTAQKQIVEADKQRAIEAQQQKGSTMDSATPIKDKPAATSASAPAAADAPPSASSSGGHGQQVAFNQKMAEDKLKALEKLRTRWEAPNSIKFVPIEEEDQTLQQAKSQNSPSQTQQVSTGQAGQQAATQYKGNHVPAGFSAYATLDKSINSDAGGGMVKATIHGGQLDGAVVLGKHDRKEKQLLANLTTMTFKGHSIPIDAIAINAETTEDSIATEIDDHIISRWGALAGAAMLEGAATMAEKSGQTMATTYAGPLTVATNYNTKQLVAGAVGNVGRRGATIAAAYFNTPPTLTANRDDEVGIIFATQTEDSLWLPKITDLEN